MENKQYKSKVVFLHKSQKGGHLYAFDYNGAFITAIGGSIIMNVSEVEALIAGKLDSIKVSIVEGKENEEGSNAESG